MVLVLAPDFAGMGDAIDVDLIVAGLATNGNRGRGGIRRSHGDYLPPLV